VTRGAPAEFRRTAPPPRIAREVDRGDGGSDFID
jgi:hypothetical protein